MSKTSENVTVSRVAAPELVATRAWLVRRRVWEERLAQLERASGVPTAPVLRSVPSAN